MVGGLTNTAIGIGEAIGQMMLGAGGIALVALGTAVKGAASSIASSGGKGSVSSNLPSASSGNYGQTTAPQQVVKVVAEFVLRGKDLVAVGRQEDYRVSRTG